MHKKRADPSLPFLSPTFLTAAPRCTSRPAKPGDGHLENTVKLSPFRNRLLHATIANTVFRFIRLHCYIRYMQAFGSWGNASGVLVGPQDHGVSRTQAASGGGGGEMAEEDFEADGDEYAAAGDFDFVLEEVADALADGAADAGQREGDEADDYYGISDVGRDEGQGDSDGECIDAGGDGEGQEDGKVGRVGGVFGLFDFEGLPDHFETDGGEDGESDPVVAGLNGGFEAEAGHPANEGHDRLEAAEEGSHLQGVADSKLAETSPSGDTDGEGVHCQGYCDEDNDRKVHDGSFNDGQRRSHKRPMRRFRRGACFRQG